MGLVVHMSESGQLELPALVREAVGLDREGPVTVWVEDGEIRLRAVRGVMASLQAEAVVLFKDSGDSVEAFLAERREDAATETRSF